jgi:hypothetical protein
MSEVDEIDAELQEPVNRWLNSNQQTRYARLLMLARQGESALIRAAMMARSERQIAEGAKPVRVWDQPPILPSF